MKLHTIYENVQNYVTNHYGPGKSMVCHTCSHLGCFNSYLTRKGDHIDTGRANACAKWRTDY